MRFHFLGEVALAARPDRLPRKRLQPRRSVRIISSTPWSVLGRAARGCALLILVPQMSITGFLWEANRGRRFAVGLVYAPDQGHFAEGTLGGCAEFAVGAVLGTA